MDIDKVKSNLQARFELEPEYPRNRHIIFWYDDGGGFKEIVDNIEIDGVRKVYLEKGESRKGDIISTNIFELKYELEMVDTTSNFLIYSEYSRPSNNRENYLLDIELYSEYFEANKASMIIEEFLFDRHNYEITNLVKKYEGFFGSKERKGRLKTLVQDKNPKEVTINELKLGILASLVNTKTLNIDDILVGIVSDREKLDIIDKWFNMKELYLLINNRFNIEVDSFDKFMKILLVVHFYKGIARNDAHINLANYFVGNKPDIYLFADNLLQNKTTEKVVKEEFYSLGRDLSIIDRINELELEDKVSGVSFEFFDQVVLREIVERLDNNLKEYDKYRSYINIRLDNTLWKTKYHNMYIGLLSAINFLDITENLFIEEKSSKYNMIKDYTSKYYKVDRYYREFYYSYDNSLDLDIAEIFEELSQKISMIYEEKYLVNLSEEWAKNIEKNQLVNKQRDFYKNHVAKSDTRVAVIISDALRYEVGQEIYEKLKKEGNSKEIVLENMVTDLPSITSLGMANLLPHNNKINFDIDSGKVTIDGLETSGTKARESILQTEDKNSSAITYNDFRDLKRIDQEGYIKGKKVIYIYHDTIDAIGDKQKTERNTFNACKQGINDITNLTKTLSSLGVVNVFITSDHGFLYERNQVEEYGKLIFENSYESLGKRYGLSNNSHQEKGCVSVELAGYNGVFPIRNNRIKTSGGGLQFVHGGLSIQETLVPLIKFRSGAHSTRSRKVEVRLKKEVGKITSNISRFSLYQVDPVNISEKVIERDVKIALFDDKGAMISDEVRLRIDETEENMIHRFNITLKNTGSRKGILMVRDGDTGDILDTKEYDINISITADFDF